MALRMLLVEPNASTLVFLRGVLDSLTQIDVSTSFSDARTRLLGHEYDRLVANLRLPPYNGLHLAYLAPSGTRSIVYTDRPDTASGRDVQDAGAFYESLERLHHALVGYIQKSLPASDRRSPSVTDRRASYRGGRRCKDVPAHETA